jgi:hypothetical protein
MFSIAFIGSIIGDIMNHIDPSNLEPRMATIIARAAIKIHFLSCADISQTSFLYKLANRLQYLTVSKLLAYNPNNSISGKISLSRVF